MRRAMTRGSIIFRKNFSEQDGWPGQAGHDGVTRHRAVSRAQRSVKRSATVRCRPGIVTVRGGPGSALHCGVYPRAARSADPGTLHRVRDTRSPRLHRRIAGAAAGSSLAMKGSRPMSGLIAAVCARSASRALVSSRRPGRARSARAGTHNPRPVIIGPRVCSRGRHRQNVAIVPSPALWCASG